MAFERLLVRSLLSVGSLSLSSASAGCPARFWHDSCPIGWGLSSPVRTWGKRGGDYCKITGREGGGEAWRESERFSGFVQCQIMTASQAPGGWCKMNQSVSNLRLTSMTSTPDFWEQSFNSSHGAALLAKSCAPVHQCVYMYFNSFFPIWLSFCQTLFSPII